MMTLAQTIFIIIASLVLVKGIIIILLPKQIIHIARYYAKNEKNMRKGGVIGIIIAIILFVISRFI